MCIGRRPRRVEGNRPRIFQRFFTSRPEGAATGSGLGLAIVQTIAEAHGGGVALLPPRAPPDVAEDAILAGATFKVTLAAAGPPRDDG